MQETRPQRELCHMCMCMCSNDVIHAERWARFIDTCGVVWCGSLRRLGVQTSVVTKIGTDPNGVVVREVRRPLLP